MPYCIPHTERYLTMVSARNNNKFYRMVPGRDTFTAIWGRIGTDGARCDYPICQWDAKYAEKISKGYSDQSDTVLGNIMEVQENRQKTTAEPVLDFEMNEGIRLMARLASFAKRFVRNTYQSRWSAVKVNASMIAKVDELIARLDLMKRNGGGVDEFNDVLSQVFMAIPRVMSDTRCYYASSSSDFERIIQREAGLIDSLRGIAKTAGAGMGQMISVSDDSGYMNAHRDVERYGMTVNPVTDSQKRDILRHMGTNASRYVRAWRIENAQTKNAFDAYRKKLGDNANVKQLWHGSRNENFHSILCSGLLLNPNAAITGKMFGYGIYFAPSFAKSMGYTSIEGSVWAGGHNETAYMAVFDVALGRSLDVYSYTGGYGRWREDDIRKAGCDSLFAHKGQMLRNDEIIVYNEAAMTIRYLVEIGPAGSGR